MNADDHRRETISYYMVYVYIIATLPADIIFIMSEMGYVFGYHKHAYAREIFTIAMPLWHTMVFYFTYRLWSLIFPRTLPPRECTGDKEQSRNDIK